MLIVTIILIIENLYRYISVYDKYFLIFYLHIIKYFRYENAVIWNNQSLGIVAQAFA